MMWEKVRMGDVIAIKNGKDHKKVNNPKGIYPIVGSGGIMGYADAYLCEANCTVIGRKGSINNPLYFEQRFWNVDTAFALCPGPKVNPKFYYYFCKTYNFEKHNKATTLPSLTKSDLEEILIPLPPLPIQKRIAEILDTADTLRRKDEALLKKYDELAQAIFIDMFGDPVKNEKGWEVKTLGNLFKSPVKCGPFGSALKREEFTDSGIPVWNMDNIVNYKFKNQCNLFINEEKYQNLKSYSVQNGDIIISRAGTVGKMCVIDTNFSKSIISTNLIKISLDSNHINPFYFISLMKYFGKKIGRLRTGSDNGFTHMNTGVLEGLTIPLPPVKQQNVFFEALNNIEFQCQNITSVTENLFNSLLQKAFSGELVK